jgi:RHS repeat-associated protein
MLRSAVLGLLLPLSVAFTPRHLDRTGRPTPLWRTTRVFRHPGGPGAGVTGCETFITITQYPSSPHYSLSGAVTVEWGEIFTSFPFCRSIGDPDPATFQFTVNDGTGPVDRTSYFSVSGNLATATAVPFSDEKLNEMVASITGHDTSGNPRTDTDTRIVSVDMTPVPVVAVQSSAWASQYLGRCDASCFTATYAHSTPAYISLDTPRSATLVYHGDRVSPKPFIHILIQHSGGYQPQSFSLQVKINGALQTFTNGQTTLYFAFGWSFWAGGQIDASTLATGVYNAEVIVSANYTNPTKVETTSQTLRLPIVNENPSRIARGWTVAGVQRLYGSQDANGSVLITEGEGSAVYYNRTCSTCSYTRPAGEFAVLVANGTNGWTRYYPDSTRAVFNATGQLTQIIDRFSNTTALVYDGSGRLSRIQDPTYTQSNGREIVLAYGTYGLASIRDSSSVSRVTYVTVASDSTLRVIRDPDGDSTRFAYDSQRRLETITDRRGSPSRFYYSAVFGKLDSLVMPKVLVYGVTDSVAPTVWYTPWQVSGVPSGSTSSTSPFTGATALQATVTDPLSHQTRFLVNAWGSPTQVVSAANDTASVVYNADGLVVIAWSPPGVTYTSNYDSRGRLLNYTPPGGATVYYRYGSWGQVDSVSGGGRIGQYFFLNATNGGRADSVRLAGSDSLKTRYLYDSRGRVTRVIDAEKDTTLVHYDAAFGNLDSTLGSGNRFARKRFDHTGRDSLTATQYAPWSMVLYDALNRPTTSYDTLNAAPTLFTYDKLFLVRVRDPANNYYRFQYNNLGWLVRRYDPADTTYRYESYDYDQDGRPVRWTNRRGQATSYSYDVLDRPLVKSGANTTTDSLSYSADRRRVARFNGVVRDSSFYNVNLQPDSVVTQMAGRRYRFYYHRNSAGLLDSISISNPGGVAFNTRRFDRNGTTQAIDTLRVNGSVTRFVRNNDLLSTQTVLGTSPGVSLLSSWTRHHQTYIDSLSNATLNATLGRTWDYDSLGRVLVELRKAPPGLGAAPGRHFVYDRAGRLAEEHYASFTLCGATSDLRSNGYQTCYEPIPADSIKTFAYDAVGNRTDHSGSYTAGNRISSLAGFGFAQDLDGNDTLRSGNGQNVRFHWTAEGRLDTVRTASDTVRYAYDPGGRLARRWRSGPSGGTHFFLWNGDELVAELDSSSSGVQRVAEYAYYPGIDQPLALITGTGSGTQRYFTQDNLGNVTGLITGSGIAQSVLYDAWGKQWTTGSLGDTNRLRWKGLVWDGDVSQLYYMRNRWYDPQTGRFLSEDPIGLDGGINAYAFAGADPINGSDPLGLLCGQPGEPACPVRGIDVTAPACDWRCLLQGIGYGEFGSPLGPWYSPGIGFGRPGRGGPGTAPGNPNSTRVCAGTARVLSGNTRLVGRQGAFPGVRVALGTAAIDPRQFGGRSTSQIRPYIGQISGSVGGRRLFTGVTDVIGGTSPIRGMNVRDALNVLFPGQVHVEVVGSPDLGTNVSISLNVPEALACPTGTAQR